MLEEYGILLIPGAVSLSCSLSLSSPFPNQIVVAVQ